MGGKRFSLSAEIDTDNPAAVEPVLRRLISSGTVELGGSPGEFVVRAEMVGESPKALNRSLLSELRRAERRTRLRAEWTFADGTTERYFDYVLKKTFR